MMRRMRRNKMSSKFFYKRSVWMDYICIIIGTGLIAMSIQCVYDPINLVTGGFTGLGIIIKDVTSRFIDGGIYIKNLIYVLYFKTFT